MYRNTVIALMEGVIGGLAFWLVGLPSAVLWGAVMTILAYLPLVGAGFIWIPAAGYLFWQGTYLKVIVLVVVGAAMAVMDYLVGRSWSLATPGCTRCSCFSPCWEGCKFLD